MNLELLKYFHETARLSHMTRAANHLHVSQSAVSRAIKKLEDDLGTQLITHQKRHFQLTEAGELVFAHASKIFDSVNSMREAIANLGSELFGPLRLACSNTFASTILVSPLDKLKSDHPKIELDIKLGGSEYVRRLTSDKTVDSGILVDQGDLSQFKKLHLFECDFVVVRSPSISAKKAKERLIVARNTKESFTRYFLEEYNKKNGRTISPYLLLPSWLVCKTYALNALGAAILPRFTVKKELASGDLMPIEVNVPPRTIKICAITPKSKTFSRNTLRLFELIKETNI